MDWILDLVRDNNKKEGKKEGKEKECPMEISARLLFFL